jgi:Protein tyrosine/serine phosphatase
MHLTRNQRMINLEMIKNVRDIGGYETQSGHFTKAHKYVRAATPSGISENDKETLYQYGVRVIIDLRSAKEIEEVPNKLKGYKDIIYYHIDVFNDPTASVVLGKMDDFKDMGELYIVMLDHLKASFKAVFDLLIKHNDKNVLYHCSAGKDRTGVISALLLDLAGVYHYDIIKDYSESYENNKEINEKLMKMMPEVAEHYLQSDPIYMMKMINHIENNYGSSKEYLLSIGVKEEDLEDLKDSFII